MVECGCLPDTHRYCQTIRIMHEDEQNYEVIFSWKQFSFWFIEALMLFTFGWTHRCCSYSCMRKNQRKVSLRTAKACKAWLNVTRGDMYTSIFFNIKMSRCNLNNWQRSSRHSRRIWSWNVLESFFLLFYVALNFLFDDLVIMNFDQLGILFYVGLDYYFFIR